MTKRCYKRKTRRHYPLKWSIPRPVWVLIELFIAVMILRYAHVPIGELLSLLKLLAS